MESCVEKSPLRSGHGLDPQEETPGGWLQGKPPWISVYQEVGTATGGDSAVWWQVPGPIISPSCRNPHPEVQSHGSQTRISLRREKERVNRSHNRALSSGLDGPSKPH